MAAGPAALAMTPLPTKRPAPITPPMAIMLMWRCFSECCKPVLLWLSLIMFVS